MIRLLRITSSVIAGSLLLCRLSVLVAQPLESSWEVGEQRYMATVVVAADGQPAASVLLRAPAISAELLDFAAQQAQAGFHVVLQQTQVPAPSDATAWMQAQAATTQAALVWIAQQEFSNGVIGLVTVGAAVTSLEAQSIETARAAVLVDAPATLADVFCRHELPRVAESIAVVAAQERRSEAEVDWSACSLDTPLVQPEELSLPLLWISGWYRTHPEASIAGWQARKKAAALRLGAWSDEPSGSRGLGGRFQLLAEAFEWLRSALRRDVMPDGPDGPDVRFDHLKPASSASAPLSSASQGAADWPPICSGCQTESWFFKAGGALSTSAPGPDAPTSYRYDPSDPVYSIGGGAWHLSSLLSAEDAKHYALDPLEIGPLDQRRVPQRDDYLRFRSDPLDQPLHLRGEVTAELWVATDAPETSFVVKLVHSYPDGHQALLRERAIAATEMTYGLPKKLIVDLGPLALTVPSGHRIALHVSSSSWPNVVRHPNVITGAPGATSRPAHQSIYHDRTRPSALLLPVVSSPDLAEPDVP